MTDNSTALEPIARVFNDYKYAAHVDYVVGIQAKPEHEMSVLRAQLYRRIGLVGTLLAVHDGADPIMARETALKTLDGFNPKPDSRMADALSEVRDIVKAILEPREAPFEIGREREIGQQNFS